MSIDGSAVCNYKSLSIRGIVSRITDNLVEVIQFILFLCHTFPKVHQVSPEGLNLVLEIPHFNLKLFTVEQDSLYLTREPISQCSKTGKIPFTVDWITTTHSCTYCASQDN